MTLEDAVRKGDLELVAKLAQELATLAQQGKANAVKQLFSVAPLVSKNMKPERANVEPAVERQPPHSQTDGDSRAVPPMHSVGNLQYPEESQDVEEQHKTLGCGAQKTLGYGAQGALLPIIGRPHSQTDRDSRGCGAQKTLGYGAQGALLPIIEGRLYLTCASSSAGVKSQKRELWVALNKRASYSPLCADFGPLNLGTTNRMCKKLHGLLSSPEHRKTKIIFCTSTEATDITNTVTLLGAFLCLRLGYTVAQALRPFEGLHHRLIIPFRDATWVKSTFDLHVEDCLAGLERAVTAGIYKLEEFCDAEYLYYDEPVRGDMHEVVPGKFIAFRGPVRDHREAGTLERGDSTLSASDYLDVFKDKNVSTIIRLNSIQYSSAVFKRAGFQHFDLPFPDCAVPSDRIVDKFLRIAEEAQGVVAVHCLAGLGRTGTLIALYLMKHHGFTAREVMGWIRICRPGSIIGPQQHYLEQQQSRMHMLGVKGCAGLGDLDAVANLNQFHRVRVPDVKKSFRRTSCSELEMDSIKEEKPGSFSPSDRRMLPDDSDAPTSDCSFLSEASTGVQPDSAMIAGMVTQGMLRRDCLRLGVLPRSNTFSEYDRQEAAPVSGGFAKGLIPAKLESKSLRKYSTQAHSDGVFPCPPSACTTISAKSTSELCEEKGSDVSGAQSDNVTVSAAESFSSRASLGTIRSMLDPEHFEYAERLMAEVGQHPCMPSVNKLPPVEWGSYVRSVHCVCVCVCERERERERERGNLDARASHSHTRAHTHEPTKADTI
jgi:cell division cycle 14